MSLESFFQGTHTTAIQSAIGEKTITKFKCSVRHNSQLPSKFPKGILKSRLANNVLTIRRIKSSCGSFEQPLSLQVLFPSWSACWCYGADDIYIRDEANIFWGWPPKAYCWHGWMHELTLKLIFLRVHIKNHSNSNLVFVIAVDVVIRVQFSWNLFAPVHQVEN